MRARDTLAFVWALTLVAIISACHSPSNVSPPAAGTPSESSSSETSTIEGTVRRLDVEGGCWVIDTSAGRIQPTELPADYRIDGLRVDVTFDDAPDVMSACQAGEPKVIRKIRVLTKESP